MTPVNTEALSMLLDSRSVCARATAMHQITIHTLRLLCRAVTGEGDSICSSFKFSSHRVAVQELDRQTESVSQWEVNVTQGIVWTWLWSWMSSPLPLCQLTRRYKIELTCDSSICLIHLFFFKSKSLISPSQVSSLRSKMSHANVLKSFLNLKNLFWYL